MNDKQQACTLGEKALTEALEKIDDVDEETFRDAKSIIELLKENLSLWKEEDGDNAVEDLWYSNFCNATTYKHQQVWYEILNKNFAVS